MKFLRFHRGIGPVIINLSRLYLDLVSMAFVFIFITIAWTFGLVYILNHKEWLPNQMGNSNEVINYELLLNIYIQNLLLFYMRLQF